MLKTDKPYTEIGNRLREWINYKFQSIPIAARHLEIEKSTLYQYTQGFRRPGYIFQERLRKEGCDIDLLMTGKTKSAPNPQESIVNYLQGLSANIPSAEHQNLYISMVKTIAKMEFKELEKVKKFIEVFYPLESSKKEMGGVE